MNKKILTLMIIGSLCFLTGCMTERVNYTSRYTPSYAYSTGHTRTSPYWNVGYAHDDSNYYGYDDLGDVGYWGMYNSYNVY